MIRPPTSLLCAKRRWLTLLAAAFAVPAFAQIADTSTVTIRNSSAPRTFMPIWTLSISGQWPTQCPPTLQNVTLVGSDLRVEARSMLELCAHATTPFSIELNPALALQNAALAHDVYRVSFYTADGAQAPPILRGFALVDRSAAGFPGIVPETGFWSSNGADRTLLSLELQGDQLSAALLSYDAEGQPAWLFGSAPYTGHVAHVSMLRLSGGSAPFAPTPSSPHGDATMTLDLQFSTSAHAQAWLSQERSDGTLQLRALDISRLPLSASVDGSAWQGEWVSVGDAVDSVPQRLQLHGFQELDAQHFQLASDDGAVVLACAHALNTQDSTPQRCNLRLADGSTSRFDSVAIGRMDGTDANGVAVHLLRVKP